MPLPKIELVRYPVKVPSLGKMIEYRPFTVKEQKELMISQESDDNVVKLKGVCHLIEACCMGNVPDAFKLKMYDIEYLLLKIRAKSVGEISAVKSTCSACEADIPVNINLESINVHFPDVKISPKIQVSKDVFIELKEPCVSDFIDIIQSDKAEEIMTICKSISKVYDSNKVYDDFTEDELIEFVENLDIHSMESIQAYFESLPSLKHTHIEKCHKCQAENEITIEGINNFFD